MNKINFDDILITQEDKRKHPYTADNTVKCFKLIEAQTTEFLLGCVEYTKRGNFDYSGKDFTEFLALFGVINPRWLSAQIAEELYERHAIDGDTMDRIVDE